MRLCKKKNRCSRKCRRSCGGPGVNGSKGCRQCKKTCKANGVARYDEECKKNEELVDPTPEGFCPDTTPPQPPTLLSAPESGRPKKSKRFPSDTIGKVSAESEYSFFAGNSTDYNGNNYEDDDYEGDDYDGDDYEEENFQDEQEGGDYEGI